MSSPYYDTSSIIQVIGCVFNKPTLLDDTDRYVIHDEDFINEFHKIVFGSIYNIHSTGSLVTIESICDYLENRPKYNAIFKQNKGVEYLTKVSEVATLDTFNYYYGRLKKMSLLRAYTNVGIDVTDLYDPSEVLDSRRKQEQEEWLDNSALIDIANIIDGRIEQVRNLCVDDEVGIGCQAGDAIVELVENLRVCPEVGIPLYGRLINTVTRGARLRKFYLRSAATGLGKTRTMIADACNCACDEIYDDQLGWYKNGLSEPTLFIATEQDKGEIQTMMLAFISNVNEDHILTGAYQDNEYERVMHAADIIKRSNLWIEQLPDFSLQDVENKIKKHIREHDVKYVFFDYIQTSMKILEEVTRRSGGVRLREDNVLFMLSVRLKDLCNKYGIFIESATQLSGDYRNDEAPDQNLLRGAKSIADKVDVGSILLNVSNDDLVKLEPIMATGQFQTPNVKLSVYKNRRGSYKGCYLWCYAELGVCRVQPMFVTNYRYELIPIEDIKVIVEQESAF